jgi:endonuclease/exonuclease/phosphatase family metal-dependent hydrolase
VLLFSAQDRLRWSINPVQPRRGGRIAVAARTAGVLVYNTHIESGTNEELKHRQIAEILAHQAKAAPGAPVMIAGDFNNGSVLRSLALESISAARFDDALGDASGRGPTSLGQRHPIDWIFVRNIGLLSGRVVDAPFASDHSPVFASVAAATAFAAH